MSLDSVFLLSNRLRGMVKIVWCLSESSHFLSWDSFHLSVLLKITVPFTFFLKNEVLVWTLMMCLTVALSESSIHVWESLVLQVKIISIWLLFVIWVPRWVFSLGKSGLDSWNSKLSVVPLAQVRVTILLWLLHSFFLLNFSQSLSDRNTLGLSKRGNIAFSFQIDFFVLSLLDLLDFFHINILVYRFFGELLGLLIDFDLIFLFLLLC